MFFNGISLKKKHSLIKRLKLYLIFTGFLLIGLVIFYETQIVPFELKCIEKESGSVAAKIINQSVNEVLEKHKPSYSDLAEINYSETGNVNSIETNSVTVNKIKSDITTKIQNLLDEGKVYYFSVPLGAFTKLNELNSLGPDVEINFKLTGSVNSEIKSSFESAGVNQTIHHMYLVITLNINTISPEYSKAITISSDYELAQTVIVGNIPNMYASINK